jgi:iron complex transport system permease protein
VTIVIGVAALLLVVLSLWMGTVPVTLWDAVRAAVGIDTGTGADFIVGQLRAPRVYTAALVGALLAASGALMQSIARNALASPDLLGISAGAAAGAVLCIYLTRSTSSLALAPWAVSGALVTSALVIVLGSRGRIEPFRMIIAGIGINFVATAITTLLLTKVPQELVPQAYAWIVGSTNARTWQHVAMGAASCLVIIPIALYMVRKLRVLEMGDDLAAGLGLKPGRLRFAALATAAVAAGLAAALVGPIAFVALVAPAIARRITRSPGITIAASALMGVILVVGADLAARELLGSLQLPVGLYTSLIGGPYLIYLIVRSKGSFQ